LREAEQALSDVSNGLA